MDGKHLLLFPLPYFSTRNGTAGSEMKSRNIWVYGWEYNGNRKLMPGWHVTEQCNTLHIHISTSYYANLYRNIISNKFINVAKEREWNVITIILLRLDYLVYSFRPVWEDSRRLRL